jgi:MerR family mercuric resistance operon transcriptional regulator
MKSFTIGQIASAAGVPASTLRFYERAGLVKPDFRTGANYRGYGEKALRRIKFIRSAQSIGLRLDDIKAPPAFASFG